MDFTEKCLTSKEIYKGYVFSVYEDQVELPNGKVAQRERLKHNGGVALVAFTPGGKLLMVRQYRYGANTLTIELPAGKIDPGEDPATCGIRELEEETGYRANKLTYLTEFYPTPAYCSEKLTIYVAEELEKTEQNLDPDEFLEIVEVDFEEAVGMCLKGEVKDAKTSIGILTYAWQKKGK